MRLGRALLATTAAMVATRSNLVDARLGQSSSALGKVNFGGAEALINPAQDKNVIRRRGLFGGPGSSKVAKEVLPTPKKGIGKTVSSELANSTSTANSWQVPAAFTAMGSRLSETAQLTVNALWLLGAGIYGSVVTALNGGGSYAKVFAGYVQIGALWLVTLPYTIALTFGIALRVGVNKSQGRDSSFPTLNDVFDRSIFGEK